MTDAVQSAAAKANPGNVDPLVNDFQIIVATINGTGSQTSNSAILRALFKMGIPVNGKNIFPSNIQGLPTWYTIRASKDGYIARLEDSHILIAMNPNTAVQDARKVPAGGLCLYDEVFVTDQRYKQFGFTEERDDIIYYRMPIDQILSESDVPDNLKDRVRNMVYVGVLARLIDIDLAALEYALMFHFGKEKPVKLNMTVIKRSYDWAGENYELSARFRVEQMNKTAGMLLLDGNSAAAMGATFGGVNVIAWYPITPSTSVADAASQYLANLRRNPETGEATYAIIQAEDELAAIGMVLGAGWAGARAMTATSGPGISLMSEFAGMAYFAEIPSVIWDIQRMGPSTGLPTRVSQGDVMFAYMLGHGDSHHPVLLPANLEECFEFGWRAFDLAARLQTLIFVLSDLDLGMNQWMGHPFEYPDTPMDHGKILSAEDLEKLKGDWGRYRDVDGDGIAYRTLPGTQHWSAAYFTRGTGHDENAIYSEDATHWENNLFRLRRKFDTARTLVPQPAVDTVSDAQFGIISYGTSHSGVEEARDRLTADGHKNSYLRLKALPLSQATYDFIAAHDRIYVVENNFDGQMAKIIQMDYPEFATRIVSVNKCDGWSLSARWIKDLIVEHEQERS